MRRRELLFDDTMAKLESSALRGDFIVLLNLYTIAESKKYRLHVLLFLLFKHSQGLPLIGDFRESICFADELKVF